MPRLRQSPRRKPKKARAQRLTASRGQQARKTTAQGFSQLELRHLLELSDPFAAQLEGHGDLVERAFPAAEQAESVSNDVQLALVQFDERAPNQPGDLLAVHLLIL